MGWKRVGDGVVGGITMEIIGGMGCAQKEGGKGCGRVGGARLTIGGVRGLPRARLVIVVVVGVIDVIGWWRHGRCGGGGGALQDGVVGV